MTPIYWSLVTIGVLYLLFDFATGFLDNSTPLNVFRRCVLYDFIYICTLALVYYLKKYVKKLAKKQDGVNALDEKMHYKKEIFFLVKIYLLFLLVHYAAIYVGIILLLIFSMLGASILKA